MTQDYKDTLNLPITAFPMKANLAQREPEIMQRWLALDLYRRLRENSRGKPRFILHDGPPYANARPHLGTALNKIIKDMVVKSKILGGYDAPYVPGWDCHGLPIELNVEKKIGKVSDKLSPEEFRKACREYATQQVAIQMEDFQRLGVVGDWRHPYLTMDFRYEANTVRALAKMIANGHLHRGEKPVHWCTACGSALADTEVEYQDKSSPAIDVGFAVVDPHAVAEIFNIKSPAETIYLPIWTTTPWTLPANQAVAVNSNFDYVLVALNWKGRKIQLICAKELVAAVMQRYGVQEYEVLATVNGEELEGLVLQHPYLERRVPVILGDHVTIEAGTGAVHTAPAHGQDDYVVGQQYQLPMDNPVNSNSCFNPDVPLVGGLHVFKANEVVIAELQKNNRLFHEEMIQHSYPHCWRHKTPLIFRATPQWFISMDQHGLRNQALSAAEQVVWIPAWGKTRISRMLETRPDWCISRQRVWGVPIPLFTHKITGERHPQTLEIMEKVAQIIEKQGVEGWFGVDPVELLGAEAGDYDKMNDVLDVWFDSGSSHFCVLEKREELGFPADLYFEGSDQHRGWFQTSLLTAVAMRNEAPYKTVLTHGYVVDGHGRKMSKSLGNVVVPVDVAKNLGADVLRLWVASADYKLDINYSEEILKRSVDAYRRIRNTVRFLLANIFDFAPDTDLVAAAELLPLDRWAITETATLQQEIIAAYNDYSFQTIYQKIHNFCSVQMGSFYLDIIKDRQYTSYRSGIARRSAQTAMYHIVEALVRWLAPMISFTAEEIWQYIPGKRAESVFLTSWYHHFPDFKTAPEIDWSLLIPVRDAINKVLETHRRSGGIGSALDAEIILYAEGKLLAELSRLGGELRFVLITSGARVLPLDSRPDDAETTDISGLYIKVIVSENAKCARCWQRREDVGVDDQHPALCGRCVENISAPGETRHFA
jgi:isoleucyl-tRNA synthetase